MNYPAEACRLRYYELLETQVSVKKKPRRPKKGPVAGIPDAFGTRDPTRRWKMNNFLRERALKKTGSSVVPLLVEEDYKPQAARRYSFVEELHTGLTPTGDEETAETPSPSNDPGQILPNHLVVPGSVSIDSLDSALVVSQNESTIQTSRFIEKHKARLKKRDAKKPLASLAELPAPKAKGFTPVMTEGLSQDAPPRTRKSLMFELEHADSESEQQAIMDELAVIDSEDDAD
eukprot:Gregarina_sp_Pseudo_9__5988@NODE_987_length_2000_cov_2_997450_g925_i0_p2_GENE_NODE_987_length_2000_cov_2_997450_g925_i0NODE_987_length_2000_cov_2_997450_g925_i0_p2_ORF_typecomplete_len232_score53_81_NODE_987_length_2000_cov_2_997450_g925_i012041899